MPTPSEIGSALSTPMESPASSIASPPILGYNFPKPEGEIDIDEALKRKPLRWTFQGQMDANKARRPAVMEDLRKKNLEQAKKDLLKLQGTQQSS
ncbi:hypothetical protein AAL_04220 [Moelleriella libera RCEF 2490]|uniref:Uncharacterized protein n=1 Tax=Moelleriella libera RCEF 2490 TaxID=1081109 RepID=A0A168BYS8_9HYPO|nr:hypothetical protein AAL_04220 [Moelleriella libera RCEF 2490]